MAEPQTQPNSDSTDDTDNSESQEKAFWDRFGTELNSHLDGWFEKKREELRKVGTSRSGGRTTLPQVIAGFMFGPDKKD